MKRGDQPLIHGIKYHLRYHNTLKDATLNIKIFLAVGDTCIHHIPHEWVKVRANKLITEIVIKRGKGYNVASPDNNGIESIETRLGGAD